jgi:mannosyltransferase
MVSTAVPTLKARAPQDHGPAKLIIAVTGIVLVAAILDFHLIGAKSLWFDEGMSLGCASLSWPNSLFLAIREPVQWPYYLVLRFFLLFGRSEAVIRLPSALFMIAAVLAMFTVSRRLFGDLAGFASAALLAVNAAIVSYAQEARSYAMEVFLVIASVHLLCNYVHAQNRRNQLLYVFICGLMVYTHIFAAFAVLAQGLALLAVPSRDFPRSRWWQTYSAVLFLTIPIWVFAVRIPRREMYFMPQFSWHQLHSVFDEISGHAGSVGTVLYLAIVLGCLARAVFLLRSRAPRSKAWPVLLSLLWAILPMLITIVGARLGRLFLLDRYTLIGVPGIALAAGALVAAMPRRSVILPVVAVFVVVGVFGVRNYFRLGYERSPEDYPALAEFVSLHTEPGDAIAFYWGRMEVLYKHYADQLPGDFLHPEIVYPASGSIEPLRILITQWQTAPPLALRSHARLWLVLHRLAEQRGDPEIRLLTQTIGTRFREEKRYEFPSWMVVLYSQAPAMNSETEHD